jgi:predicted nucleotidyltransferase
MLLPGAVPHDRSSADLDTVACVLRDAVTALDERDVPYLLIGGLASALLGRPRCTGDIDLLVAPEQAPRALEVLEAAGFETEQTNPHWLFKAFRDDVLIDVLFQSCGGVYLDAEMLARARTLRFRGVPVRVIPAEDLIVIKAIAHDEETPRHWWDALALLSSAEIDWVYLLRRARKAPKRLASLLLYADSLGLLVPAGPLRKLAGDLLEARERTAAPEALA